MIKVKGPKGIDTEHHFLPWSFEPCREAHFSQHLRLFPSATQGRSRMIDRGRDEERYVHMPLQPNKSPPKHALRICQFVLCLDVWEREGGALVVAGATSLETPCYAHTTNHQSPLSEPLL